MTTPTDDTTIRDALRDLDARTAFDWNPRSGVLWPVAAGASAAFELSPASPAWWSSVPPG